MVSSITKATRKIAQSGHDIMQGQRVEKIGLYIKLDRPVVDWFKSSGPGYQSRINEVLKRFVNAVTSQGVSMEAPPALESAQELFEKYYEQCFWHMKRDMIITAVDLPRIIKGLKTYGGRSGYMAAAELCR